MAEKFPGWSSYNYTLLNPVNMVDPDGRLAKPLAYSLIGSVIGAVTNYALTEGSFEDKITEAGRGAVGGIVSGLVVGIGESIGLSKTLIGRAVLGAASGAASEFAMQAYEYGLLDSRDDFDWDKIMESAVKGGILGPILGALKTKVNATGNQSYSVIDITKAGMGLAKQVGDKLGKRLNNYFTPHSGSGPEFMPDLPLNSSAPCPRCHGNSKPPTSMPSLLDKLRD